MEIVPMTKQGVRDLDADCRDYSRKVAPRRLLAPAEVDQIQEITDLIYGNHDLQGCRGLDPNVTFEHEDDWLKGPRYLVVLHTTQRKWYRWLLENDLSEASLHFQMSMFNPEKGIPLIWELLDELNSAT